MAKWIIEATPNPDNPESIGAVPQMEMFDTDHAAKDYAREMLDRRFLVTVRSAPGIEPLIEYEPESSSIWANAREA
jgi:hypothetical protein